MGRAAHEHVDFFGSSLFQGGDPGLAGGAPDNGIIHDHHAFPAHQVGDEVEFDPDVEVTDELRGLQEASADVVISHEGHLEGDTTFQRVSQCSAVP